MQGGLLQPGAQHKSAQPLNNLERRERGSDAQIEGEKAVEIDTHGIVNVKIKSAQKKMKDTGTVKEKNKQ